MPKRIFNKPTTVRGKKALRKSYNRIFVNLSRAKGKHDLNQIVAGWRRNKTREQKKVLREFESEKVAEKNYIAKRQKLAKEIDKLYRGGQRLGLLVFVGHAALLKIQAGNRLNGLKQYRDSCVALISILELIKEKKTKYSNLLSKGLREKYFKDLPMPPEAKLKMLKEYVGVVQKAVESLGEREPSFEQSWMQLVTALNASLIALSGKYGI